MQHIFCELPVPYKGIIGHRGAAGLAPENTFRSFQKAAALGLNWIEFDVQRCASGEWVLLHDETLERTTNGHGFVVDTHYQTLKTLDAGAWFNPPYYGEKIPLLTETLSYLKQRNLQPNIELKGLSNHKKKEQIIDFLSKHRPYWANATPPLISSFDIECLIMLRQLDPTLPLGYLIEADVDTGVKMVQRYQFNSLHCSYEAVKDPVMLNRIVQEVPLLIYTVNQPQVIRHLLQAGVTAVFSDLTNNIPQFLPEN